MGSLKPSVVLVILLPTTQQSLVFIMAFSGTRWPDLALPLFGRQFSFLSFLAKIRKRSLISGIVEDSESFVLRLRCYRNVKKSWTTSKMNDQMCCLVSFVFSQNVYSVRRENENGDKTCLHYEMPQPSRPESIIMKTWLKRFAPVRPQTRCLSLPT